LKATHNVGSLSVRSGDTVRILRGDRKGFEGKVVSVDRKNYRVFVEGVTREKVDGTTALVPIHPSKVMITNLNLDDRWRRDSLKAGVTIKEEEKPAKEEKPKKARKKRKPRKPAARKAQKKVEEVEKETKEEPEGG